MKTFTTPRRWLGLLCIMACFAGTAYGQNARTVTLTLNSATIPDTTNTDSFMEVRGAVNGVAPITLLDGNVIDWSDASTLEPENIGGDYWRITFQIADTTDLTFKFYSQQAQDAALDGWEADPNPNIPPGADDVDLPVHFFESANEYRGAFGDRGDYDWRPYEPMEGMVAIWFRVAMFGENADLVNYDPAAEAPAQQIGVRGDNLDTDGDGTGEGPLDWGITQVLLDRESTNTNQPGYNIYSGVAYYPEALVGTEQAYKFVADNDVLDDGTLGWEDGNLDGANRTFTVPAQDSTLHWVYFGNTAPVATDPVASAVIFSVDLTPLEEIGLFDVARGDTLEVRGDFNGWDCAGEGSPDDCELVREPGSALFEQAVPLSFVPGSERNYKFFLNLNNQPFREQFGIDVIPSGWEEPITTQGANRTFIFEGIENDFQVLDVKRFNDILSGNIIPEGTSVDLTFQVDMNPATENEAQPFDPANDLVTINIGDPFWSVTQGFPLTPRDDDPNVGDQLDLAGFSQLFQLTDENGDLIYEGTMTVEGPTYGAIQYVYVYGQPGAFFQEPEGSTAGEGRRRTRFINPNADGSWPAAWSFPPETFKPEGGPFEFEENPVGTGIEVVDGEVPTRIELGENYPNPFNPSTAFEYRIDAAQHVRVRVFDVLGRNVATLVDGMQSPNTYKVTFEADHLASGIYFYQLEVGSQVITKTMTLLK